MKVKVKVGGFGVVGGGLSTVFSKFIGNMFQSFFLQIVDIKFNIRQIINYTNYSQDIYNWVLPKLLKSQKISK